MRYFLLFSLLLVQAAGAYCNNKADQAVAHKEAALAQARENCPEAAIDQLKKALKIYRKQDDIINWIASCKAVANVYRDEKGLPEQSLPYFKACLPEQLWRQPVTPKEWEELGWLYVNLAHAFNYGLEQYHNAARYYNEAKKILVDRLKKEDAETAVYIFQALGNVDTRLGDYEAAEVLLEKFRAIAQASGDNGLAAEAYSDLGILYETMGRHEAAMASCRKGLMLPDLDYVAKGLLCGNYAKACLAANKLRDAERYARNAENHFGKAVTEYQFTYARHYQAIIWSLLGNIYHQMKRTPEADRAFGTAFQTFTELYGQRNSRDIGKLLISRGKIFMETDPDQALAYFQQALQSVLENFSPQDFRDNPPAASFYAENTLMEALSGKAEALRIRFRQCGEPEDLQAALECHELIFEAEKLLRQSYHYESSKLNNIEESYERCEHAIAIALQLWQLTGDASYKNQAFTFAERSRAILLMEAFRKADAENVAGIPQETQSQESQLQADVALAEERLFQAGLRGLPESELQRLKTTLWNARQTYATWMQEIEAAYPQYYNLKYNFSSVTPEAVRQRLDNQAAVLEYFVGTSEIFLFVLTRDHFDVLSIAKDFPLEDWVITLRNSIVAHQQSVTGQEKSCETYTDYARKLYEKLVAPAGKNRQLPRQLTIIPAGVLAYLPFDALLTKEPSVPCRFNDYPYLLLEHSIGYGYSATLQATLEDMPGGKRNFGGFAPAFTGSGGLASLEYNIQTVEAIGSKTDGIVFTGNRASVENFRQSASGFGVLHLATHAQANTTAGNFSFVVLSDGNNGYDSLFVKDLYLLDLTAASMVVLSACETADGALYKGEGVVSLARAFLYAGARSVLTTFWSINDIANKRLMTAFFENLKTGAGKAEALRQAKLTQIKESDSRDAHPVYWAAFTAIGDDAPIYRQESWMIWAGMGILGLIGIVGWRVGIKH
ncbi:MAG: CHAT domain-containing protein [Saprospiraceae bacterium]|nr:CHAT domain-containing protein [Saprospiraceae bacterium]